MPAVPLAIFDLTVTPRVDDTRPGAVFLLNANHPTLTTTAAFLLNLTTLLQSAYAANVVQIGVQLEADFGGGYEVIPYSEQSMEISIGEHLDAFTDDCSISFSGDAYSPLHSAVARAKTPVRLTGYYGVLGGITSRTLFEGYVHQGQWNTPPAALTLQLLDLASKHSEKTVSINIAPGSLMTRQALAVQILAALAIPYSEITLPKSGGRIAKGKSEGGTKRVFEYLNQILSPVGATCANLGGPLTIKRFAPATTPDRILTAADIGGTISIESPATSVANVITATGSTYDHDAIDESLNSNAPEVTETVVIGPAMTLNPLEPEYSQDSAGVLTPYVKQLLNVYYTEISRIKTETTRSPTRVTVVQNEWGWLVPKCAPMSQSAGGVISYLACYQYEDGSFSYERAARYQLIRTTISVDDLTASGTLKSETTHEFGVIRRAYASLAGDLTEVPYATSITAEGEGWTTTTESMRETEKRTRTVTADATGLVTTDVTQVQRYGSRPKPRVAAAFVYGPFGSPSYKMTQTEDFITVERETISYVPVNANTYLVKTERYTAGEGSAPRVEESRSGSRPTLSLENSKPPTGQSQLMTASFRNLLGIAMNGEIRGSGGSIQNEECETPAELTFVAKEKARELGAFRISFPMPWDLTIHKGKTIQLNVSGTQYDLIGKNLLVTDVERTLNLATTENGQNVTAVYYPLELQ